MSRPLKIEITQSEEELKKRLQTASEGAPKGKTPDAVVAQKWSGQGAARNRVSLGHR